VAFVASFGFIRTSTHLIRAQVSWWPGNVETKGGTHVHHLVWGILLLMSAGYLGVTLEPGSPWAEMLAVAFGIGMGLTLDEFALWLNLEDVYWSPKGRQSIDAVILAACLLAVALFGLQFWIDLYEAFLVLAGAGGERLVGGESALVLAPAQALGVVMAGAALLKGKLFTGIVGMFVPVVGLVGGVRLAKPDSRWARRYDADKLGRSKRRFANAG